MTSPSPERGAVAAEALAGAEILRVGAPNVGWVDEARRIVAQYDQGDELLGAVLVNLSRHDEAVFPDDIPVVAQAFADEGIDCGQEPCRCEEIAQRVYLMIYAATL